MDFHQRLDSLENRLRSIEARTDISFAMLCQIISLLDNRDHNSVYDEWDLQRRQYLDEMVADEATDPDA